jgi:hypothetical protein
MPLNCCLEILFLAFLAIEGGEKLQLSNTLAVRDRPPWDQVPRSLLVGGSNLKFESSEKEHLHCQTLGQYEVDRIVVQT